MSKNILFCPDDIKAIADEITRSGKIAMKKLEEPYNRYETTNEVESYQG